MRTVPPFAAGVVRVIASEIARILLSSVEATYSVPLEASASPVGPSTRASAESIQGMPLAITVSLSTFGVCPTPDSSSIRSTVELSTVFLPATGPPFSALLTNSIVLEPSLFAVESQGPWMFLPAIVSTALPSLLSTIRQPYFAVAVLPLVVGRLPTTT